MFNIPHSHFFIIKLAESKKCHLDISVHCREEVVNFKAKLIVAFFVSLGLEENLLKTSLVLKGEKNKKKKRKDLTIHHTMPNNRAVDSDTQKVGYW